MIKIAIIAIIVVIFFLLSIFIYPVLWIIGKFNLQKRHEVSLAIIQWLFRLFIFIAGVKLTVKGKDKVPKDGSVLYIGNHRSIVDVLVGYTLVDRLTGFIAKKEIKKYPFLNWWMMFMNCLFLDRNNNKEGLKTILKAIEMEKNGISIFIFPEGTRSRDGSVAEFKAGSFKIAEKAKVPIVPIAFNHTEEVFENQKPFVKSAKVTVEFGDPIYVTDLSKEELKNLNVIARDAIVKMLEEQNKAEA